MTAECGSDVTNIETRLYILKGRRSHLRGSCFRWRDCRDHCPSCRCCQTAQRRRARRRRTERSLESVLAIACERTFHGLRRRSARRQHSQFRGRWVAGPRLRHNTHTTVRCDLKRARLPNGRSRQRNGKLSPDTYWQCTGLGRTPGASSTFFCDAHSEVVDVCGRDVSGRSRGRLDALKASRVDHFQLARRINKIQVVTTASARAASHILGRAVAVQDRHRERPCIGGSEGAYFGWSKRSAAIS